MTCWAMSTYSGEYVGSERATHSAQPSASGVTARTSRMSRSVWVPKEVRNGATNGRFIRRSSRASSFMASLSHFLRPLELVPAITGHVRDRVTLVDGTTEGLSHRLPPAHCRVLINA